MKILKFFAILIFQISNSSAQWTELEVRRMLEETNQRHAQIERMTKEAAIRHNQNIPDAQTVLSRATEPPIPAPAPPPAAPAPPAPSAPTIEDDRTFLAKMSEQEALVNQLNALAVSREAATRNGLLAMEGALLNAIRPFTLPFLGPPIPGHFVPFQRMQHQKPIEQSPPDDNLEIQSRPMASQLPMREKIDNFEMQKDDEIGEMTVRNETTPAF